MIPFANPVKALRSAENAPFSALTGGNHSEPVPGPAHDAPAALLRSPYGLPPQGGGTPTLHTNNSHQLSQQVDL